MLSYRPDEFFLYTVPYVFGIHVVLLSLFHLDFKNMIYELKSTSYHAFIRRIKCLTSRLGLM